MKNTKNLLWGIAFIAIGAIIALNALGVTNINLFFNGWWAILFIVLPCFIGLFKNESKTGNIIGIIIGAILFLCCQDLLDFELFGKLIVPIILIGIGVSFIFKDVLGKKISGKIKEITAKSEKNKFECNIFRSKS